jgi:nucleoside-diphosphate-sugar epimerase
MERVLVTGATGFIGQHVVRALQQQGKMVRMLVRPQSACKVQQTLNTELVTGDLFDLDTLKVALRGVHVVYHLAGQLHIAGVTAAQYQHLHVEGTRSLLNACLGIDSLQAVIHCSTTGVLGPTGCTPATEKSPFNPKTTYEQSKAVGEKLALGFAEQHGLPLTVARPSLVYGPGDLHLLGWYRAIQGGYYRVVGRGDNLLHPIYIDDLVTGLLQLSQVPAALGRVYHIVGPQPVSIEELATAIAHAVGQRLPGWHIPLPVARCIATTLEALPGIHPSRLPLTHSRIDFMVESRAYSGERAETELHFTPNINLETGLQQTVAWYRRENLL